MHKSLVDLIRLAIEASEEASQEALAHPSAPGDVCLALEEAISTLETALRQCPPGE